MTSLLRSLTIRAVLVLAYALTATPAARAQADHLQCFKVKDAVAKQLYQATLTPSDVAFPVAAGCVVKVPATMLCIDVQKTNVTPAPPGAAPGAPAQKFLCYKVKCPKVQPTVTLGDQFGSHVLTVKATSLLCAPVAPSTTTTVTTASTTSTTSPCSPAEVCGNAIDDDCDGSIDVLPCSCTIDPDCPQPIHASSPCVAGQCTSAFTCDAGFGDCNGLASDGCETSTQSSVNDCGTCNNQCSHVGGVAGCTGGVCTITCNVGRADCDGNVANGCEVNTQTDVLNCGSCLASCGSVNGTPSCTGGVCTITCNPGAADCNGLAADGCETNTQINHFHCGGCFLVCPPATPTCASGVCQ